MPSPKRSPSGRRSRSTKRPVVRSRSPAADAPAPPPVTEAVAWRLTAGDIGSMTQKTLPLSAPGSHQVMVEVHACGLNFADIFACLGLYSATPEGEFTPGLEFSGIVCAVGDKVTSHAVGDRVFGVTRFGGYATYLNVGATYCRPLPDGWSFEEGASYAAQALTAFYGIVKLGALEKGHIVLVHSVAGGTGLWAANICRKLGAKVIGTVGSADKVQTVIDQTGMDRDDIIDRSLFTTSAQRRAVLAEAAKRHGNADGTFDLVFDSLMGEWFGASHELVGTMGRHVVLGSGSMTPTHDRLYPWDWARLAVQYLRRGMVDPLHMISQNKSVMAFNLIWLYERSQMVGEIFAELDAVTKSLGKPLVGDVFTFDNAPEAIRRLKSGKTVGKVVLSVPRGTADEPETSAKPVEV